MNKRGLTAITFVTSTIGGSIVQHRITVWSILLALLSIAILGSTNQVQASATKSESSRAIASYNAMQAYFYTKDGSHLYREQYPSGVNDNPYSYEWPFSQAHIATLDLATIPGSVGKAYQTDLVDRSLGQEKYWNTTGATGLPGYDSYPRPPYGNGGDKFYDDNAWVGLAKIQLYLTTGDVNALARAKQLFALDVSGWDTDSTHAAPGGIFWTQAPWSHDRNTVSNMPVAEMGLRLYQITHDSYYLDWAKKTYNWTNDHLLAPNGLYWDHLDLQGNIEKTQWSYNQGISVGASVLFYQVTGDKTYLKRAESIAKAALAYYGLYNRLYTQPSFFNSIFFKNLLLLQSVNHDDRYRNAMETYANNVWKTYRDSATGLFHTSGSDATQLLEQGAMTQIYAVLSWKSSQYGLLY